MGLPGTSSCHVVFHDQNSNVDLLPRGSYSMQSIYTMLETFTSHSLSYGIEHEDVTFLTDSTPGQDCKKYKDVADSPLLTMLVSGSGISILGRVFG